MVYGGYSYIDLKYKPGEDDFIVFLFVKGREKIEKLAEAIAAESSVGTWTELNTMNERVFSEYRARVFKIIKISENSGYVFIAYPYEHFDSKNIAQIFASVFGNVFGLKELEELYYFDIRLPLKFQKQFTGAYHGLEGIRKYLGTEKSRRPHVGTIVKPKVGLAANEFAAIAYKAWVNGLDLVKDDENLVDQSFCSFKNRFNQVFSALDRAEKEAKEKKLYFVNITDSSIERMLERIDYLRAHGHEQIMLDVFILGMPALSYILEITKKYKLITHAHRAGYAAMHRANFGMSFAIFEKFYRLLGVDQLHIGTGVGKMEGNAVLIKKFNEILRKEEVEENIYFGFLEQKFSKKIKAIMPVASGGLNAMHLDALVVIHGRDITAQAGGGVHGHKLGIEAGAKSMRIASEIVARGERVIENVDKYPELKHAYEKWGYEEPEKYEKLLNIDNALVESIFRKGMLKLIWEI